SVYAKDSPKCDPKLFEIGVPVLGICYGHQLIAHALGGEVREGGAGEYGTTKLEVSNSSGILKGMSGAEDVWMNHRDVVEKPPAGFRISASTDKTKAAVFENPARKIYGVQFHPEVTHTVNGMKILENFVKMTGAKREWTAKNFLEQSIEEARDVIGGRKAVIGLSGGVDSSAAAVIVSDAVGKNLTAVYVDTGLMRKGETEEIRQVFSKFDLDLRIIDAGERFFKALKGVKDPEQKRKIIGKLFIDIFDENAKEVGAEVLVQGTIYSDRIESGITKHSSNIKSHHNVGGLPKKMKLEVYEPLREIYKDEVREVAREAGLPKEITEREVFPGPGLAIRMLGEVTPEKAEIVRETSAIVTEELKAAGLYDKIWMGFTVLLPVKSVGVQGDERSYKYPLVVRIIESKDAMTANFSKIPFEVLEKISSRITNEVREVNRVVYDITNKPPATMEWE
ncbi:MAG TPA: glutamine-hydrolyzing GMP synthase, partial [Candidatus Altiarchaeales archaeon]|nr:glutamine-hydrolyzing GMP synthase [Candidatus Altiarchaeales archaeon]